MVRHCVRTFLFGQALAAKAGASLDLETLYVGSLFHDLGLEERFAGPEDFEILGAREADRFLGHQGYAALGTAVAAAIELHTLPTTAADPRPEVAYLNIGASVDVIGARLDEIEPKLIQRIVAEFPRDGTKALLHALLEKQIIAKPASRIATLHRQFNVLSLVDGTPFES